MRTAQPRVLDLYAGAGGLSLGFLQAGAEIVGAVEMDDWAASTYRANIATTMHVEKVSDFLQNNLWQYRGVDILIGGPPCQGFSIAAKGRKKEYDQRNDEVLHFVNAAIALKPRAVLMENVAHFTNFLHPSGYKYLAILEEALRDAGYEVSSFVLDAADYGVPQRRSRAFVVATQKFNVDLREAATHSESGQPLQKEKWLSVDDAIGDLPEVLPGELSEDAVLTYDSQAKNYFQMSLRSASGVLYNHIPMRHTPRLVERFSKIPIGGNGLSVWDSHAPRRRGDGKVNGVRFDQNHRRMNPQVPAPTIAAYMYSTCVHPYQNRNITIREAARLQSFPDDFRFYGKRTTLSKKLLEKKGLYDDTKLNQLNQVGNAVPPLLARKLASAIIGEMLK